MNEPQPPGSPHRAAGAGDGPPPPVGPYDGLVSRLVRRTAGGDVRRDTLGVRAHRRFRALPGGGYVASGFALDEMARWVHDRRPRRVLELGPGIGTTTAVLVAALDAAGVPTDGPDARLHVCVERSEFCLQRLDENLGPDRSKVRVVEWPRDAPPGPYDLVVIDGLGAGDGDPDVTAEVSAEETARAVADLAPRAVVFVENNRAHQRRAVESAARPGWRTAHVRPWDGTPGYHVYVFDPSPGERVRLGARRAIDRLWHPKGLRILRHGFIRVRGSELRGRQDVAVGSD